MLEIFADLRGLLHVSEVYNDSWVFRNSVTHHHWHCVNVFEAFNAPQMNMINGLCQDDVSAAYQDALPPDHHLHAGLLHRGVGLSVRG